MWTQRNSVELKAPKMTIQDGPEAFLESFERAALSAGLDKVVQLGVLLIG